jgi:hypothetical protein
VIQQGGGVPVPGFASHPERTYQTEQSAKLDLTETGTSVTAGQTLSTSDDRWLRKVGAEQKLFGGVSISGSIASPPASKRAGKPPLFRLFDRPLPTAEMSSIAATRPRCGQIRPPR